VTDLLLEKKLAVLLPLRHQDTMQHFGGGKKSGVLFLEMISCHFHNGVGLFLGQNDGL